MDTLDTYKIDLKNMRTDSETFQYVADDAFFKAIQGDAVKGGQVNVGLTVRKTAGAFRFLFRLEGTVTITCDRCLDDMELPVDTECELRFKLGDEYADEGDVITIPYEDGIADVAWNIYEFIALEIPLQHVHEDGECNKKMMETLNRYNAAACGNTEAETESETGEEAGGQRPIDPRWNELKKILDNN